MVLADLYDLTHAAHAEKRPKPYPRPWKVRAGTNPLRKPLLTPEQVARVLAQSHTDREAAGG
jgi:hypothetical protein